MLFFRLEDEPGKVIEFEPKMLINAGYTGRNREAVKAHIDELALKGIPAPEKTPTYFPKVADRVIQDGTFEVLDETDHSGEGEFCLICHEGVFYVTPSSDHTDRKLEEASILKSKQIYPNVVGTRIWKLDDLLNHWDSIVMKSWVTVDGKEVLYQETTLSTLMEPQELIERIKELLRDPENLDGLMVFSGTVAALFELTYSPTFKVVLEDPVRKRSISCSYDMRPISRWYVG
ncbi:MAG: DUF2848 family protein [Synergistales bacterium]|jgi:hypothetical protein|nr:DUF2848 family protein [Synergistales bacterium]MDD5515515.1 DUF2848 family protein [Synergistales bacterium]MDI9393277.1 DUF2848 family protein [Synergistota bacterium]